MFEALFESAPYAMLVIDPKGRIMHANAHVESLFGYPRAELLTKPIELLLPAYLPRPDIAPPETAYADAVRPKIKLELQGRHKNATEFPVEVTLVVLSTDNLRIDSIDSQNGARPSTVLTLIGVLALPPNKPNADKSAELYHYLIDRHNAQSLDMAQKLHNGPLQELEGLNFALAAFDSALKALPVAHDFTLSDEITQMRKSVRQISGQLRALYRELHPISLTSFGLSNTLPAFIQTFQAAHPALAVEFKMAEESERLPHALSMALWHVCQQALANIVQHAQAHHVQVKLQVEAEHMLLEIKDDGCGFAIPQDWSTIAKQGCLGLISAQERVGAAGGYFHIASAPGQGTTICITAPISSNQIDKIHQI